MLAIVPMLSATPIALCGDPVLVNRRKQTAQARLKIGDKVFEPIKPRQLARRHRTCSATVAEAERHWLAFSGSSRVKPDTRVSDVHSVHLSNRIAGAGRGTGWNDAVNFREIVCR
jgi:hypothetical protein